MLYFPLTPRIAARELLFGGLQRIGQCGCAKINLALHSQHELCAVVLSRDTGSEVLTSLAPVFAERQDKFDVLMSLRALR